MTITKQTVADRIAVSLHHEATLAQLADWAENGAFARWVNRRQPVELA